MSMRIWSFFNTDMTFLVLYWEGICEIGKVNYGKNDTLIILFMFTK